MKNGTKPRAIQGRTDIAAGVMVIRVLNEGDRPVEVTAARYDDPRFAQAVTWSGESTIPAGNARDLRAPIPAPSCTPDAPAAEVTTLRFADGTVREVPTSDPLGLVDATTATACLAGRVERAVSLTLSGPEFRGDRGAEVAVLTLHAEPLGPPTVRVVEVAGTPLLRPEDGGAGWPVDLTVDGPMDVPLAAAPNRCDPHGVADDKVGTRFRVTVELTDDGATGQVVVAADDTQRSELYRYLTRRCGT